MLITDQCSYATQLSPQRVYSSPLGLCTQVAVTGPHCVSGSVDCYSHGTRKKYRAFTTLVGDSRQMETMLLYVSVLCDDILSLGLVEAGDLLHWSLKVCCLFLFF